MPTSRTQRLGALPACCSVQLQTRSAPAEQRPRLSPENEWGGVLTSPQDLPEWGGEGADSQSGWRPLVPGDQLAISCCLDAPRASRASCLWSRGCWRRILRYACVDLSHRPEASPHSGTVDRLGQGCVQSVRMLSFRRLQKPPDCMDLAV